MTEVGIDAVEIWTGKLKLDLPGTFAPEKGDDPEKYTKARTQQLLVPGRVEDIVTMGANAAKGLMDRKGLKPEDIGRIDVATESAFDHQSRCRRTSPAVSNRCTTATSPTPTRASASSRVWPARRRSTTPTTGSAPDGTATARRSSSRPTPRCTPAATRRGDTGRRRRRAMLIDEDPSIVALSTEQGYGSKDETDFLKPNQQFPSVDGKRRCRCTSPDARGLRRLRVGHR